MVSTQSKLKYLKRREDELSAMEDLLTQGNFAEAASMLHKVKGSASTFEFELLGTIAAGLEAECLNPKKTSPAEALHLFASYRDNILTALQELE